MLRQGYQPHELPQADGKPTDLQQEPEDGCMSTISCTMERRVASAVAQFDICSCFKKLLHQLHGPDRVAIDVKSADPIINALLIHVFLSLHQLG